MHGTNRPQSARRRVARGGSRSPQLIVLTSVFASQVACGTDIVARRKDGTTVEGTVTAREGDVLIVQEPFFSPNVDARPPPPLRVPVSSLEAIRIDRPGAVSFGLGLLSTLVGVSFILSGTSTNYSSDDRSSYERSSKPVGGPGETLLGVTFLGIGVWQFYSGATQLHEADLLLGPALDLPRRAP